MIALVHGRAAEIERQLDFLLRLLTPRTVFMEVGSRDGELSLRVAGYVERVWCVEAKAQVARAPCNLRAGGLGGVPVRSIDVAFSERLQSAEEIRALLKPGGVWLLWDKADAAALARAGFARADYYAGRLRVPQALARIARTAVTAAYR